MNNPPTIGDQIQSSKKKTMQANTLLERTIKTLALNRELLDNFREDLRGEMRYSEAGEAVEAIDEIDKLMTEIRTFLLPS